MKLQSAEAIEEKKHRQSWRRTSLSASMFDPLSTRDIIKRSYDDIALLAEGNEDVFGSVAGFRWAGTSQIPSPTDSRNETPETSNREEVVGGIMYMDELDKSISGSASNRPSLSLPPLNIPGNAPSSSGYGTMAPVEPMRYESLRELRRKSMSEDGIVFGLNTPILGRRRTASGDTPDGSPTDKDRRRSRVGAFTAPKGKAKDTNSIVGIAIQEPMAPPSSSSKRQLSPSMSKMGEIAQHNGQPQSASRHQNQTMTQEEHPWYQQLYQVHMISILSLTGANRWSICRFSCRNCGRELILHTQRQEILLPRAPIDQARKLWQLICPPLRTRIGKHAGESNESLQL